ncbi:MAG: SDR family oxidoreductase [Rhodospirillales bacterium]|nr:SDR family oxidoreductase [Rhodospirillales bacterium]
MITGGSSGIGAAIAEQLARQGASIFLVARHKERLDQAATALRALATETGQKVDVAVADVSDPAQAADAVKQCEQRFGGIDLLINSAGITLPGYVEDTHLDAFRAQMDTNFMGVVHMVRAALPAMIARRDGWIANLSSVTGLKGVFGYAAYSASKFAVVGYSEVLRSELVRHNIGVTVICPPDTRTPMLAGETPHRPYETAYLAAKGKVLEPDVVARALLRGIEKRKSLVVPGFDSKFLRFANGIAPDTLDWMFDGMIRSAQKQKKGR